MRCCRWSRGLVLMLAVVMAGCNGTGGGSSDSGNPFVFQSRGRLNIFVLPTGDPRVLSLSVQLLDPQNRPFINHFISFSAGFPDATFIPGEDNRGSVRTDDTGRASITLVAGLTVGRMRVLAEAFSLDLATGISVDLTQQGFISLGALGIIPAEITFINPLVKPGEDGPSAFFNATGGSPPYRWDNTSKNLGRITILGLPNINEQIRYTLTGPIPTDQTDALIDTITVQDAAAGQASSMVRVLFADCKLRADGTKVTLTGVPGAAFDVNVADGVPSFTVTETFPGSVIVRVFVLDAAGNVIPGQVCDATGERCVVRFTLPDPPGAVNPDTILIRDARGCTAAVELTVNLCGNGMIDSGREECDPPDFGGLTCADFKGAGATGVLRCGDDCKINDGSCQVPPMMMP